MNYLQDGVTLELIRDITLAEPSDEECRMLEHVSRIESLITTSESLALHRLCCMLKEPSNLLEIGSYQGASTAAIGHAICRRQISIYCVDPWADYLAQNSFKHLESQVLADDFRILRNFIT